MAGQHDRVMILYSDNGSVGNVWPRSLSNSAALWQEEETAKSGPDRKIGLI